MSTSLANGLRVLEEIADQEEAGVSEIARTLGLTVGTTHRLVRTLVDAGFVEQNETNRRYRVSTKIGELARASRGGLDFIGVAHPALERLQTLTGETVNLGVLRDEAVVYIDRVVSDQPLSVTVRMGSRVPAYCTALGRALLAYGPAIARERYLARLREIAAGETQPPPPKRDLVRILDDTRDQGFSEDAGEFYPDIACLAAPILGRGGEAVAAISVSGPRARIQENKDELVPIMQTTAKELSDLVESVGYVHL